jgi:glucose-6-phosphate isomerase
MKLNLENGLIKSGEFTAREFQKKIHEIHENLHSGDHSAGTTWVDWPVCYDKKEFTKILKLAKHIEETSDALLVVGIGGSYLGAKAGIDMLAKRSKVEVVFAGTSFDYSDLATKLDYLKDKDVTVNVVSKSGTTVEILSTLNIVERFMKNKYKNDYKTRMIYTTDKAKGYLREQAVLNGIETLTVPDNMGGRYSVLSSVGLLPLAVAGVNIKKIMEGVNRAYLEFGTDDIEENAAYKYAIYRYLLNKKLGKKVELFSSFSLKFASFGSWLQQLFCESEGKDKKGLFVSSLTFSTDLHSVGQFIQQGSPILAETFIDVKNPLKDNVISNVALGSPIKFLDGKSMGDLSRAGFDGTVKAHKEAGVPIAIVEVDEINEDTFGYLVYFFEIACATSAYLLGVNPFNQPGVESYKTYMKELLKK